MLYICTKIINKKIEIMSKYSKTPKLTSAEKLAFYKENGYWFGTTPKATLSVTTKEVNREEIFKVEEVKIMSASERVAIEEMNIAMRANARKNNL